MRAAATTRAAEVKARPKHSGHRIERTVSLAKGGVSGSHAKHAATANPATDSATTRYANRAAMENGVTADATASGASPARGRPAHRAPRASRNSRVRRSRFWRWIRPAKPRLQPTPRVTARTSIAKAAAAVAEGAGVAVAIAASADQTTDETVEAQPEAALVVAAESIPATSAAPWVSSTHVEAHDPAIPEHTATADVTSPTHEARPSGAIPARAAVPKVDRAEPAAAGPEQTVARAEPAVERMEPAAARAERAVARTEPDNVAAQPAKVAAVSPPEIETVSRSLPPDSDLVMVETRFAPAVETDEPAAPRGRRVRPARPVIADEPLQMVETRKEQPVP